MSSGSEEPGAAISDVRSPYLKSAARGAPVGSVEKGIKRVSCNSPWQILPISQKCQNEERTRRSGCILCGLLQCHCRLDDRVKCLPPHSALLTITHDGWGYRMKGSRTRWRGVGRDRALRALKGAAAPCRVPSEQVGARRGAWGAEGRRLQPHLGRRRALGAGAGGAALRAARVPGLGPAPRRPMRARGRRGCPHTLSAAPLGAADPLTPHPSLGSAPQTPSSARRRRLPDTAPCAPLRDLAPRLLDSRCP